jgi:hypothetical protein
MSGPGYLVLVALHALAALVGFGALGATGAYASALRRSPEKAATAAMRRFFRPGRNVASRMVLFVPLLGGAALALGRDEVARAFPWIGLGLWTIAVAVASAWLWPAERAIQHLVARISSEGEPGEDGRDGASLERACRRCERAATLTSLCFLAALVVMVAQP